MSMEHDVLFDDMVLDDDHKSKEEPSPFVTIHYWPTLGVGKYAVI